MNYNYYAKQDYYAYLSSGVGAWQLLLPISSGLKKGDTVTVLEVDNNSDLTGNVSVGTVVFISSEGILNVSGNQSYYYINSINNFTMYTIYRATISQSGTDDPVVTVLQNTTDGLYLWVYDETGVYGANNTGITDFTKVQMFISTPPNSDQVFLFNQAISGEDIGIATYGSGNIPTDGLLINAAVTVYVFD